MKIKDVTPSRFSCAGGACPAVYETDKGTYLIVGNKVANSDNLLSGKIGPNETIIEVPVELIRQANLKKGVYNMKIREITPLSYFLRRWRLPGDFLKPI